MELRKYHDKWKELIGYDVWHNSKLVGFLSKVHHTGSGRYGNRAYVGSWEPYDTWDFDPEENTDFKYLVFDSFRKAKEKLMKIGLMS